jgi:8-oxo-dGTP pyrophosphatase MutT (NUDIX family)
MTLELLRAFFKEFHPTPVENQKLIHAGVLVPLFIHDNEMYTIFTQRTDKVEHYKGQVSFPGGVYDTSDTTIIETALREAYEEIGIPPSAFEVLGVLNDYITPTGFRITPVVAYLSTFPKFIINQIEVSEVFIAPISFFVDNKNERIEQRLRNGILMNVFFYKYRNFTIWGATAAILHSFLHLLTEWVNSKNAL